MRNRRTHSIFIAGVVAGALAMGAWYIGCSHTKAGDDASASATEKAARLLPHPAFAHASNGDGQQTVTIADVAEKSLPSVVNIFSTKVIRQQGQQMMPFFNDPFFRHFFGDRFGPRGPSMPRERREKSLGSGVIVSKDGTVLTNNHVVEHAEEIKVSLSDKREFSAKVVGTDPKSDLAVLKLQGDVKGLKPLAFGDSGRLRLGDVVIAIGNPFGVGRTVTMGIVSATGRADVGIVDYEDFIQTDAAINPGNSGGALIDMEGKLVGINTAILSRTGGYQGIGFAIPANMARPIMQSLLKHGKVVRGWLGVAIQDLKPEMAEALGVATKQGVLVSDVTAGSPAEKAGLKRGDVLLKLGGEPVDSTGRLRNLVAAAGAGAKVKLELMRGKERRTITAELGEMPANLGGLARLEPDDGVLGGLTVAGLDEASRDKYEIPERIQGGVVVQEVARDSAAARSGIRPGDVILELNRRPVQGVEQFGELYRGAKGRLLLLVYRQGSTMYLLLSK